MFSNLSRVSMHAGPPAVLALILQILLGGGSCHAALRGAQQVPGLLEGEGFAPTFVVRLDSLNSKTMPVALDDDGDPKDVTVKDRRSFKPSKGDDPSLAKRLRMKAKKDGGGACLGTQIEIKGDVTAHVRVAVDSTEGLLDGQSLAFLERRPAGGGPIDRVELVWDAVNDGFVARAVVDDVPAGDTLALPGLHEATLYMLDLGASLALQAAGVGDGAPGATLASAPQDGGDDTATFAVGAEGLGPKGGFWFARLQFQFEAASTGPVETAALIHLGAAWYLLDDAAGWLEGPQTAQVVNFVYNDLFLASLELSEDTGAWGLLIAANEDGTLLPTSNGPKAESLVKGALGWVVPAFVDLSKILQSGGTSALSVKSHVKVAKKKVETAIGLLNGFKSSSNGKLNTAVEFSLE